jgi:dihydroxyacetone kinase
MDALVPFVEALARGPTFEAAVTACQAGGESTVTLVPRLGRATYVGDNGSLPPDPGAMCVVFLTAGMSKGLLKAA